MNRFAAANRGFRTIPPRALHCLIAVAFSGVIASSFAAEVLSSATHIEPVANRPERTQSRRALEAAWLKTTDLPLNNVLSLLGVELDILNAERQADLNRQLQQIFEAYQTEEALSTSGALKISGSASTSAERLQISKHNARVAEYTALLKELARLNDRFTAAAQAADAARLQVARQLANDRAYQSTIDRLDALRNELFDSIHEVAIAQNQSVALAEQADYIRTGYRTGDSLLGRKRTEIVARLQKSQTDQDIAIDRLTVSVKAHKKENVDWDAAQRKHSQELLDAATKKVNEFNAEIPALTKANEKLQAATEALNGYLISIGGKEPTKNKREFNRRKRALASAEAGAEKARQSLDELKTAAEKAKAAVGVFVDSWSAEAQKRNAELQAESDKLSSLQHDRDAAPNLAKIEIQRIAALVQEQTRPLDEEARRQNARCIEHLGERYDLIIEAANEWLSGRAAAADAVADIKESWADFREKDAARKIYSALSRAVELENEQARIGSIPRFAELKVAEKQNNARAAWKALHDGRRRIADEQRALATERSTLLAKLGRGDETAATREAAFMDSLVALQRLSDEKRHISEAEHAVARNVFDYVIGSALLDERRVKILAAEKANFDRDAKSWLDRNPLPLSKPLAAQFNEWRNSTLINSCRAPISADDYAPVPTGDIPNAIPVESWANVKPEDWRRAIGVWFKNLEEREDGVFSIEKRLNHAIVYESKEAQREFLNGLMERALAHGTSPQIARFPNRQGVTIVQRAESGRTFALTRFWSLKFLPRGTVFEKELFGDNQIEKLMALNNLLTNRGAALRMAGKDPAQRPALDDLVPPAEKARLDALANDLIGTSDLVLQWNEALNALDAGDSKTRADKAGAFFTAVNAGLHPKDRSEAETLSAFGVLADRANAFTPGILETAAPEFVTSVAEFQTDRVAALNKLKALKAALDENVASLESLRASFAKELEQTDRISQTLESLNQSFLENWEHLWMDNLGNALAGAWNSSETFRTRATLLAEAYRSALWRIDQSLGVERERLAALREAMPVLASPEGTLTVSR